MAVAELSGVPAVAMAYLEEGDRAGQERRDVRTYGGRLIAQRLKAHGVTKLFTLSGGHLFSIYDGCREEGIDIVEHGSPAYHPEVAYMGKGQ